MNARPDSGTPLLGGPLEVNVTVSGATPEASRFAEFIAATAGLGISDVHIDPATSSVRATGLAPSQVQPFSDAVGRLLGNDHP